VGGNGYFSEKGITIYGHPSTHRNQQELSETIDEINAGIPNIVRRKHREGFIAFDHTTVKNPDIAIDHDIEFDLGEIHAQVILTPGHTTSNISVYQQNEKVLYCGDCILPEFIPNLEEGNLPEWQAWLASLEKIQQLDIETVVPGHGNVLSGKTNIENEIERIKNIIKMAIKDTKAPTIL
jgi:glyoxylase-like metal-dependent hydrolase (beta-lactamase superfamily II)